MIQELGEAAGEVAVALTGPRLLVLAGVNGTAAGVGLGLMLGGDVVLVREDAQLVLGGRRLNGTEAVGWGLATEAVAGDAFAARLTELEDALVACPRHTYGPTKALTRGADVEALRTHVRQEAASIAAASEHSGAVRRVEAFAGR